MGVFLRYSSTLVGKLFGGVVTSPTQLLRNAFTHLHSHYHTRLLGQNALIHIA